METGKPSITTEEFVRFLTKSEPTVYRYIFSLVPNIDDARDIMQETAVALWQKIAEYDPTRPFVPWACRFAYYEVQNFRKRKPRAALLSDAVLEALAADNLARHEILETRLQALARCFEKLPDMERRLLERRYSEPTTIQDLAQETGRSVHTLYKTLERIRRWLFDCINRSLAVEGSS